MVFQCSAQCSASLIPLVPVMAPSRGWGCSFQPRSIWATVPGTAAPGKSHLISAPTSTEKPASPLCYPKAKVGVFHP